jgi:hypothetical protein
LGTVFFVAVRFFVVRRFLGEVFFVVAGAVPDDTRVECRVR